ncbi:MAG: flagellin [Clostridiales bacterium]|jgi:flagellin|nr:flagellin [Eubacteriales bacterium]MDH7566166.1 flagellin [Clostridiales bacterium]
MIINHNIEALNTYGRLTTNTANTAKSLEKLSSGLRINKAGDDAAGLAISEKMRAQIRGLDQASRNAQDAISMIQTAEGALNETHSILQRMRELANQSANGTNTDADRQALQDELNQLTSEINRIGNTTEFNTQKLLNGGLSSSDGAKIIKATSAVVAGTVAFAGASFSGGLQAKITVDDVTFDLSSIAIDTAAAATIGAVIGKLKDVTSGGVKLSDLVDIKDDGSSHIQFTAKSSGDTSKITLVTTDATAASIFSMAAAGTLSATGDPTLMERAGIQATNVLTGSDVTITANSTFQVTVGSESAVTVKLENGKTYDTSNADANVAKAAMQDLVKDINAALQGAGLDGKVTASLSKDNKLQFISETGKDIVIKDGTNTPLVSVLGFTDSGSDGVIDETVGNIYQVVGPGAEGSGFTAKFQIGANKGQSMQMVIDDMRAAALGISGNAGQTGFSKTLNVTNGTNDVNAEAALDITTAENASKSLAVLDGALQKVSAERAKLGAVQNRLEHTINNLGTSSENLTAAESRIRDVDMAKEMMNFTKNNILTQAAQAMLAQANQAPQGVLQLLR